MDPQGQVDHTAELLRDSVVGIVAYEALKQARKSYIDACSRKLGSKAHKIALSKVLHGSVAKFFETSPIGRISQRFNSEISVFRGGLLN